MTETTARTFTVEEAARTLPLLRAIVGDIVEIWREMQSAEEELAGLRRAEDPVDADLEQRLSESIERDGRRLQECVAELEQLGVELKDFETGLVDFPSEREGRTVCLCWRLGEETVSHWHEVDEGLAGRRPIED